jgi:hypothetical protein
MKHSETIYDCLRTYLEKRNRPSADCAECGGTGYIFDRFECGVNDKVARHGEFVITTVPADSSADYNYYISRNDCPGCGRYVFLAVVTDRKSGQEYMADCEMLSDGSKAIREIRWALRPGWQQLCRDGRIEVVLQEEERH